MRTATRIALWFSVACILTGCVIVGNSFITINDNDVSNSKKI